MPTADFSKMSPAERLALMTACLGRERSPSASRGSLRSKPTASKGSFEWGGKRSRGGHQRQTSALNCTIASSG
jgi:hypothetical protein